MKVEIRPDEITSYEPRLLAMESVLPAALSACYRRTRLLAERINKWIEMPERLRGPVGKDDYRIRTELEDLSWNLEAGMKILEGAQALAKARQREYLTASEQVPAVRYFGFDDDGEFRELDREEARLASGMSELEFSAKEAEDVSQLEREDMEQFDAQ